PLNIIPVETILNVYRHRAMSYNTDLNEVRGRLPEYKETGFVWDESACGYNLIIEDNGKVVRASDACLKHQSVRARVVFENPGIFEWDVILDRHCAWGWVGVCASGNLVYDNFIGNSSTVGWLLSTSGRIYHGKVNQDGYCPSFAGDNSKVTVHLDMNKRTCSFTVNGVKYPEVEGWNDLPSKLYPVVSLKTPGRFRIQFH
ncbi:19662_t:CDS:1, partial [Funneliformis geosporum]